MIDSLKIKGVTAYSDPIQFVFTRSTPNIICGNNGSGKTHALKLMYSAISVCTPRHYKATTPKLGREALRHQLCSKMLPVFKTDRIGHLANRHEPRAEVSMGLSVGNLSFSFSTKSTNCVKVANVPDFWIDYASGRMIKVGFSSGEAGLSMDLRLRHRDYSPDSDFPRIENHLERLFWKWARV